MRIINPATEEVIATVDPDTPATVAAKAARAREAQREWARQSLPWRLEAVATIGRQLILRRDRLAEILTSEVGKPITQSRNEIDGMQSRIAFFLGQGPEVLAEEAVYDDTAQKLRERVRWEPLGVIANLSAWNYPYYVGSNVFLPALLAGNAVLYKPSEIATLTGQAIAEMLPAEVFLPVIGGGEVGAELLRQPIDGVFFTGSYATGRRVAEAGAGRMIRVQMELGGKDPAYVCDDVDVAGAAASLADGAFYNGGQSCCAVERIYVHERVAREFVEAFVAAVRGFKVGDPRDPATYLGPLARKEQLGVLERQVADATAKGAKVLAGGKRIDRKGWYFEPTVLVDVNHTMELMKEESFGPIIGIQPVRDDAEAARLMNDTPYGLTAAVYSKDGARAERILSETNAGTAYWNCCDRVSPRLPWSGRGHSGIGTTLSRQGILTFVQPKAWHLRG